MCKCISRPVRARNKKVITSLHCAVSVGAADLGQNLLPQKLILICFTNLLRDFYPDIDDEAHNQPHCLP